MWLYALLARFRLGSGSADERMLRATTLLGIYLHLGRWRKARSLEARIMSDEGLRDLYRFRIGDFRPSGVAVESGWFAAVADARVEELASYLLEGAGRLAGWLERNLRESPGRTTFLLYPGTGPSPFNARLRDVYLMVGHYRPREHDRTMVHSAVVHEIAHIHLRRVLGFSFGSGDYGTAKLFDEGWAELCGFRAVGALREKLAEAHALSAAALEADPGLLLLSLESWSDTLFSRRWVPLYPMALSFAGWVEESVGTEALLRLLTGGGDDFPLRIRCSLGSPLEELVDSWRSWLERRSTGSREFVTFAFRGWREGDAIFAYDSACPIRPEGNLLAVQGGRLLEIRPSLRNPRYSASGAFAVCGAEEGHVGITAAFMDRVQRTEVEAVEG
jgi:hypothetical protein